MVPQTQERSASEPADASDGPDRQQLRIVHLLVWTACVAVYLGLQRVVERHGTGGLSQPLIGTYTAIITALRSVADGAALGGLMLWAARRWRGFAFPKHPGEYLLVVLGLGVALKFSLGFLDAFLEFPTASTQTLVVQRLLLGRLVLGGLVLLWPFLVLKRPRWRWFFGALLGGQALSVIDQLLIACWGVPVLATSVGFTLSSGLTLGRLMLYAAADVLLVVVVVKDHREGIRYPWTHWLGVAVKLWLALVGVPTTLSTARYLVEFFQHW